MSKQYIKGFSRVCGNCYSHKIDENKKGYCDIRFVIKRTGREPYYISANKPGCEVFMYKIEKQNEQSK